MFSNNLNANNLQTPGRILFGGLPNIEPRHVETVNNPRASEEESDLINLLGDCSVSPQAAFQKETKIDDLQIKELEKFLSNTGTGTLPKSRYTAAQEKELQMFLDECERKAKADIVAKNRIELDNKAGTSGLCVNRSYSGTPKVLVPKLHDERIQEPVEDLIDEVLMEKKIENLYFRHQTNQHKFEDEVIDRCHFGSPSYVGKSYKSGNNNIMDQIVAKNNITFTTSKIDDKNLTNNDFFTKKEIPKQHLNAEIKELVTKHNITYLEAIKMDEKIFLKQSTLKSDAEKLRLTPGPTLYNKSVILPQIMKRMAAKKNNVDEHINLNRKLVLDTGAAHHKSVEEKTNDHAEKINAHLKSSVNRGAQDNVVKSEKLSSSVSFISKNNQTPDTSGTKNNLSIAQNNGIYRDSRFTHIDELKALRKEKILSNGVHDSVRVGPHVLRPPQSLMADCNKARFVANATNQLFNDFVNAKYK